MPRSKRLQILEFLSLHHNGLSWKQLLGKHTFPVAPIRLPDLASPDRAKWLLDKRTFPASDVEVTYLEWCFPRQTLDRVLKKLLDDEIVEKVREPRKQGKRGRSSWRYRIKDWQSWGCMYLRLPASRPAWPYDHRWFWGTRKEGRGVRMWPEEEKKFDQLIKEDETFRDASLFFVDPKTSQKEEDDFLAAVLSARRKRRRDLERKVRKRSLIWASLA